MAHRRGPGEGQVVWDGTHNTYYAYLLTGRYPSGRAKYTRRDATVKGKSRAGYADAERKLKDLKDEQVAKAEAKELANDPTNYTMWRAIEDWYAWVPTTQKTGQRTADNYFLTCQKWLKPRLGDLPLVEITIENFSDMLEEVAQHLGKDALMDIISATRRSINYAMRRKSETGYPGPNPIPDKMDLPDAGRKPRDWDFLDEGQVEHVLESCEGTPMYALMVTGFQCGLRPGELRALHWVDIDFTNQVLYVVRYLKGGERSTARRGIPMSDQLAEALKAHREYSTGDLVFTREDGQPLSSDGLSHRTGKVFANAGMPHLTDAYVMRHTFASIMDHNGVEHRIIADLMGHKNVTTFQTVYRHRLNPVVTETSGLMNTIWKKKAA